MKNMGLPKLSNPTPKMFPIVIAVVIALLAVGILALIIYLRHYKNPADRALAEAGIVEKTTLVGEVNFNYAEGPNNGPALLLLHAQTLD